MTETLEVYLSTDIVRGDLEINLHPDEDSHTPVDVAEWPDLRSELRQEVRDRLEDVTGWETRLHSDRPGRRFSVHIGDIITDDDGELELIDLRRTHPEDVPW
jgi:hypothetical protein